MELQHAAEDGVNAVRLADVKHKTLISFWYTQTDDTVCIIVLLSLVRHDMPCRKASYRSVNSEVICLVGNGILLDMTVDLIHESWCHIRQRNVIYCRQLSNMVYYCVKSI